MCDGYNFIFFFKLGILFFILLHYEERLGRVFVRVTASRHQYSVTRSSEIPTENVF